MLLPAIYGFMAAGVHRHRRWCSDADPQNMIAGARLLRRHQRHEPLLVSVFWSFLLEFLQQRADQAAVRLHRRGRHRRRAGRALHHRAASSMHVGNSGMLYLGAAMFIVAMFLPARCCSPQWRHDARRARRSPATKAAAERDRGARRQSVRGLHARGAQSPYLHRHRAVHRRASPRRTPSCTSSSCGSSKEHVRRARRKRTQMFAQHRCHRAGAGRRLAAVPHRATSRTQLGVTVLLVIVPLIIMVFGLLVFAISGTFIVLAVRHGPAPLG